MADSTAYDPTGMVAKVWDKDSKGSKDKPMTMGDVADKLVDDFEDEIDDSKKYLCMAKVAEKSGNEHDSYYLYEMAKDEYTHARFIKDFMEEHDIEIPEDHEERYHKLEEEINRIFR